MEKEKVLEIEITKINEMYSFAKVTKMNRKVIKEKKEYKFRYANSSSLETNSEIHNEPNFCTYISDTINCYVLYINSENDCFTIKNNLVESLETFLQEFNEKYGTAKRWRAKENEEYYFLNGKCEIWKTIEEKKRVDNTFFEQGNYFKTKEEAQKVKAELDKFWERVKAGEIGDDDNGI